MPKKLFTLVLLIFILGAAFYYIYWVKREAAESNPNDSSLIPPSEETSSLEGFAEIDRWIADWKPKANPNLIEKYRKALEQNPENAVLHFTLARIYLCFPDKQDKAELHFKRTLELSPQHPKARDIQLWFKLYEDHRKNTAMWNEINQQQELVKNAPNDPQEYVKQARVYKKYNMLAPARSYYKRAVQLAPENPEILFESGMFLKDDEYQEALLYFRELLRLRPEHALKPEIEKHMDTLKSRLGKQRFLYEKGDVLERDILTSLQAQLSEPSIVQKSKAIERLSKIKSDEAVELLWNFVKDAGNKPYKEAVVALLKIGSPLAKQRLESILYEPDNASHIKAYAVQAYLEYGGEEDIPTIEKWLQTQAANEYKHQGDWFISHIKKRLRKDREERK